MSTRENVLKVANEWCGTPYHHRASVKGHGADCGTLLISVYSEAGCIENFTPRAYSRQFHLHRNEEWYKGYVESWAKPVQTPKPGDVALWKIGRIYSHGAIVVEWPIVIHALAKEGCVMKDDVSRGNLSDKEPLFFTLWADDQ
jgi:cell wall-associated NlpC family hydrolase